MPGIKEQLLTLLGEGAGDGEEETVDFSNDDVPISRLKIKPSIYDCDGSLKPNKPSYEAGLVENKRNIKRRRKKKLSGSINLSSEQIRMAYHPAENKEKPPTIPKNTSCSSPIRFQKPLGVERCIDRCKFCDAPAIPGDDVCKQCYSD